jgi:cell wall-associated NlpC family hydrolase
MKKITCALMFFCAIGGGGPVRANDLPLPSGLQETAQSMTDAYLENMRDIMFYALSMVGINYRWGGSSPQTGFDCSGLVSHVFKKIAGLVLPRDSYAMARLGQPIPLDDLKPGDLVFFNTMRRPFSHVGIYVGEQRFVHAPTAGKNVHIVDMTEGYWATRYNGARRLGL